MVIEANEWKFQILPWIQKHLLFVRLKREASFDLFVSSLEELCPQLFALAHIHYARWIPIPC